MAGLFGGMFNYAKPGKGIDKNAPQKHRFLFFFELFFRKIWKLLGLNIIYFAITFPLVSFLAVYGLSAFIEYYGLDLSILGNDFLVSLFLYFQTGLPRPIVLALVAVSAILFGPLTAGMTYILRNFVREEHAWLLSDLYQRTKENFKQGLLAGLIDILLVFSCILYLTVDVDQSMQYMGILRYAALIVFGIYQIMRFYIYTIMVTFDMKFTSILKNAWLFLFLGIIKNIIIILFAGVVLYLTITYFNIILVPLLTYSLTGFIVVFNVYPTIKKYMIDPLTERDEDSEIEIEYEDEDDAPIFEDDIVAKKRMELEEAGKDK